MQDEKDGQEFDGTKDRADNEKKFDKSAEKAGKELTKDMPKDKAPKPKP